METILFSHLACKRGKIGVITLNNPASLNSLNLTMVQKLGHQLEIWKDDPEVSAVFLHSEHPKAFCAGGDVKGVVTEIFYDQKKSFPYEFFRWEYKSDYLIHKFPKPVLCWGEGIVMGGGLGLMSGASHRVVTEKSTLAMPEITIGFFTDVGAGYFLNQLPEGVGLFLGWTGARLTAADALHLKMADYFIPAQNKTLLWEKLKDLEWTASVKENKEILTRTLRHSSLSPASNSLPFPSHFAHYQDDIQKMMCVSDVYRAHLDLLGWETEDPWLSQAVMTHKNGAPFSLHLIFEQLRREKNLPLEDIFITEWNLAMHLSHRNDFKEGVRALLIDKDNSPMWQPRRFSDVKKDDVDRCFRPHHPEEYEEIRNFFSQEHCH